MKGADRILVENVSKTFHSPEGVEKVVFDGLSLEVKSNIFTTLIGGNGVGKSTLLNLIAGLIQPDSGSVTIEGVEEEMPQIGYVWQDYRASLLPWVNVVENIAFPLRLKGAQLKERIERARNLLTQFAPQIDPEAYCYRLSGGQQQLVSLVRSLVVGPDVMLFDEPFSALDQQKTWSMTAHVENAWISNKIPSLFVSHDVDEAILLADEIILMGGSAGGIVRTITNPLPRPRELAMLKAPEHIECRDEIIEFLLKEDTSLNVRANQIT